MKLDITFTITAVIALIALISPIATALINNRHNLTMKKLDLRLQEVQSHNKHIKMLFEELLSTYGTYVSYATTQNHRELSNALCRCFPYIPKKHMNTFKKFHNNLLENKLIDTKKLMNDELINSIQAIIKQL